VYQAALARAVLPTVTPAKVSPAWSCTCSIPPAVSWRAHWFAAPVMNCTSVWLAPGLAGLRNETRSARVFRAGVIPEARTLAVAACRRLRAPEPGRTVALMVAPAPRETISEAFRVSKPMSLTTGSRTRGRLRS
jgi:hypothetical protein